MDHVSSTFLTDLIRSTIALFVVIDPVGSVPVFIALTQKMERTERTICHQDCDYNCSWFVCSLYLQWPARKYYPSLASPSPASWLQATSCFSLYRLSFLHTASGDLPAQGRRVNRVLSRWHFRCLPALAP